MELKNLTQFPADIYRGMIDDDRLFGSVFARVTYDIINSELIISENQTWKVSASPWDCEYCPMDSDEIFYKGGVDIFVFGTAKIAGGREIDQINIKVEIGTSFVRRLTVFGDRVWRKDNDTLVPSPPRSFRSIPVTLNYAYGGKDKWDGLDISYQYNPDGKGFYLTEESAEGFFLPNIEDPKTLIKNWNDQPDPVGFMPCPSSSGLRMRNNIIFDEEQRIIKELKPAFFNYAFPDMIAPRVNPGDRVIIRGMHEDGQLSFTIPDTCLITRLQFGEKVFEKKLSIDQLGIEVDKQRLFIAYRYPFRYKMIALQYRSCELLLKYSRPGQLSTFTMQAMGET